MNETAKMRGNGEQKSISLSPYLLKWCAKVFAIAPVQSLHSEILHPSASPIWAMRKQRIFPDWAINSLRRGIGWTEDVA
jgi:hypothetical protein